MSANFCKHCGKPLPSDAVFCPQCGKKAEGYAPVEEKQPEVKKKLPNPWIPIAFWLWYCGSVYRQNTSAAFESLAPSLFIGFAISFAVFLWGRKSMNVVAINFLSIVAGFGFFTVCPHALDLIK